MRGERGEMEGKEKMSDLLFFFVVTFGSVR